MLLPELQGLLPKRGILDETVGTVKDLELGHWLTNFGLSENNRNNMWLQGLHQRACSRIVNVNCTILKALFEGLTVDFYMVQS